VRPAGLDQYSSTALAANWRNPRTLTTVTWRDGSLDASFVTVPKGALTQDEINELNRELKGLIYCFSFCVAVFVWVSVRQNNR